MEPKRKLIRNCAPISVVVPAYNEERYIAKTLDALFSQTLPPIEIIVVDNSSSDNTYAVCTSYINTFAVRGIRLRVITEPKIGVANARNAGFSAAMQPIIASTDADTWPETDWVERIEQYFSNDEHTAVVGRLALYDAPFWVSLLDRAGFFQWWTTIKNCYIFYFTCLYGANFAIRANAFKKVGGFRSTSKNPESSMEDFDLSKRLSKCGTVQEDHLLLVYTSIRRYRTIPQILRATIARWGVIFNALLMDRT